MQNNKVTSGKKLPIVDAHIHLYDYKINKHTFLNEYDPNYAEFVGIIQLCLVSIYLKII